MCFLCIANMSEHWLEKNIYALSASSEKMMLSSLQPISPIRLKRVKDYGKEKHKSLVRS